MFNKKMNQAILFDKKTKTIVCYNLILIWTFLLQKWFQDTTKNRKQREKIYIIFRLVGNSKKKKKSFFEKTWNC